ncbi:hypothetical protein ACFL1I_05890 [Candidatus Omnitrophota bacterium]
MSLEFLANAKFGWIFVWLEILLVYLAFLWFHRVVERKGKAR